VTVKIPRGSLRNKRWSAKVLTSRRRPGRPAPRRNRKRSRNCTPETDPERTTNYRAR